MANTFNWDPYILAERASLHKANNIREFLPSISQRIWAPVTSRLNEKSLDSNLGAFFSPFLKPVLANDIKNGNINSARSYFATEQAEKTYLLPGKINKSFGRIGRNTLMLVPLFSNHPERAFAVGALQEGILHGLIPWGKKLFSKRI